MNVASYVTERGGAAWLSRVESQAGAFVAAVYPETFPLALPIIAGAVAIALVCWRWLR